LIGKIVGPTEAVELVKRVEDVGQLIAKIKHEHEYNLDNRPGTDAACYLIGALIARGLSVAA